MTSRETATTLGAAVAAVLWLAAPSAGNLPCDGLALMTRDVRPELRDRADEFYRSLRIAETDVGDERWTNVYESVLRASGGFVTYVSLRPRYAPREHFPADNACGHADDLDIDPDARAGAILARAFGSRQAARLSQGLEAATYSLTVQAFRTLDPRADIPWRELGAPFIAVTQTVDFPSDELRSPGSELRLVAAVGSTHLHVWMRPTSGLIAETTTTARNLGRAPDTQVFRFRADLSSQR